MMLEQNFQIPVWGGIECTINRVENTFYDQLEMNGFYDSDDHIKALISCNVKVVRFPVLWEKHERVLNSQIEWEWAEGQLNLLRNNQIEPIVGLLHHGSGPAFTSLIDEQFPELFAAYAAQVAKKFPWVTYYNPINEPLTTARFSGLYGLWYPHKKNDVNFIRILLNELKGIVLAMREIRKINPSAKLIQTEDLGKTYSEPLLKYQVDFENKRRWLTYDILLGKFTHTHPLWKYFLRLGIKTEALQFFIDNPSEIEMMGVNYYITSERYLDHNIDKYSPEMVGGNTLHNYVDVEAVRIKFKEPHGLGYLLEELWMRYHIPIAITEAHLHCHREEQIRWLKHIYNEAVEAKKKGIKISAVTAWAMFGSFGWDKLLTNFPGTYEMGALDITSGKTRFTALAKYIQSLNTTKHAFAELQHEAGWWNEEDRYLPLPKMKQIIFKDNSQPILIIGKTGTLGKAFSKISNNRKFNHHLLSRQDVDISKPEEIEKVIEKYKPWAIINAAGFVDIDRAEITPEKCYQENTEGNKNLGTLCKKHRVKFVTFSTDQVFNGTSSVPYNEGSSTNPLNVYGYSKLLTEEFLSRENPDALIIRTSAFFGPWDKHNFVTKCIETLEAGEVFEAADDIVVSPTYVPHLVHASLDLLVDDANGIWHIANRGETSWYDWAKEIAMMTGLNEELIQTPRVLHKARRPKYSALTSEKYALPSLEDAMQDYLETIFKENICPLLKY